ncbi:MAG: ABC-type transporter, integral membrane subunit [Candidatus Magasanikbacteria bacterium GW2011_GWA2_56_11]|uniref:ABC-type transporter, integral membrane subunit n=1 Tax=Candidatus Magasanikbacteria bacterium GW2011_GWA2_56_11 TaxID=1619044 RepID=A0A0G1YHM6_9BACT|nr:MAG: ABC-type transporter, integral membrane subunit [Candidatus Magasanikbacteria bacterium GW2011_GWA2_56_11]
MLGQIAADSLISGSIYALMAMGFYLQYKTTRFFNFSHGSMATVAGYAVLYFSRTRHLPVGVGVGLALVTAGLLGLVSYKIIFQPMKHRGSSPGVVMVASLGLMVLLQSALALLFTNQFQVLYRNYSTVSSLILPGAIVTRPQLLMVVLSGFIFLGLAAVYRFTGAGKKLRALNDNEEMAAAAGIKTETIAGRAFFAGSVLAGLAGILVGFDTGLKPAMGTNLLMGGTVGAIVGGLGSFGGVLVGSVVLGLTENLGAWLIGGEWKPAITFILLIIFLRLRPEGALK